MILSLDDHHQLYNHEVTCKMTKDYISLYCTTQRVINSVRSNFVLKIRILILHHFCFTFWTNNVHGNVHMS
jgi:hypothetical protein